MQLELIGPHPFARDEQGRQITRIGTLFPQYGALWTQSPCVHAMQRLGFLDRINAERARNALPPLSIEEEEQVSAESVDLIFESDHILIRPDPDRMELAFLADELLQGLVSKRQVKFLSVSDRRVRDAIKHRGECWRLSSLPKTREAKQRLVLGSKVGIHGLPIYFYNRLTGTRWLTCQEFENLGKLDNAGLVGHLQEIADHMILLNRLGRPEVDFFAADLRRLGARQFAGVVYEQLSPEQLRVKFEELRTHFRSAVHEAFRSDDCQNKAWCERMLATLFLEGNEAQTEQILSGLSPEFFMQVEWLPGGRFEEGEFLFDSIFDEAASHPEDAELQRLCDPRAQGIIFNLIREYGDLEFVNVGCVPESLSLDRPQKEGRRGVYLAELRSSSEHATIKRFIRLQKWGVWEHLDEGKDLLQSIKERDDYTDYWLDRRLGCRQLGMNLPHRVAMRRLNEIYNGTNARFRGELIRTIYFDREYLPGIATDKLPLEKYAQPGYGLKLASLLGRAAATSMIVGRALESGTRPVFDDGDEVVGEGEDGLPAEILVGDHSGAFGDYKLPLEAFAAHYARPVNTRDKFVPDPKAFATAYLDAFRDQFLRIQGDYRKRRRAFESLFKHCKYDTAGSFAYRWECVLRRLDQANPYTLVEAIRQHIWVLNREPAKLSNSFAGKVIFSPSFAPRPLVKHVLFDFDGTLSLIREGWPAVMLGMFLEMLPRRAEEEAGDRQMLWGDMMRLNGKQTIYQMMQFADRIRERGGQPQEPLWYKREYLRRLDEKIAGRREAIRTGAVSRDKYLVCGSIGLLEELRRRGLRLYLASGTDEPFVKAEAELLGMVPYFGSHMYGALDDYKQFSKKMVIERILRENQVPGEQLLAFGDGYVEIQNTKEVGGLAVAVASDEANNGSGEFDAWKRNRLMEVGADVVIPDFRDAIPLLRCILDGVPRPKTVS